MQFSFLHGGNFELIEFSVVAGTDLTLSPAAAGPATTFKLANGKAAQVDTVLEPLHVVEAELDPAGGALTAQIGGVTPTTRVHVMVTHFDAVYKADRLGVSRRDQAVRTFAAQRPGSSFQAATTMSSEQVRRSTRNEKRGVGGVTRTWCRYCCIATHARANHSVRGFFFFLRSRCRCTS